MEKWTKQEEEEWERLEFRKGCGSFGFGWFVLFLAATVFLRLPFSLPSDSVYQDKGEVLFNAFALLFLGLWLLRGYRSHKELSDKRERVLEKGKREIAEKINNSPYLREYFGLDEPANNLKQTSQDDDYSEAEEESEVHYLPEDRES